MALFYGAPLLHWVDDYRPMDLFETTNEKNLL
jgi:hypothetical protein